MNPISLRTNRTRAAQRPPLVVAVARPALLARWFPSWKVKKAAPTATQPQGKRQPQGNPQNKPQPTFLPNSGSRFPVPVKTAKNGKWNGGHSAPAASEDRGSPNASPPQPNRRGSANPPVQGKPTPAGQQPRNPSAHQPGGPNTAQPRNQSPAPKAGDAKPVEPTSRPASPPQSASRQNMERLFRESLELFSAKEAEQPVTETKPEPPPKRADDPPRSPVPAVPHEPAPAAPSRPVSQTDLLPAVQSVFERFANLPRQSALLGTSDDGLPVLLDLEEPAPGSILVMGDEREAQIALLQTIIASAALRNTIRSLQIVIISHQPEFWSNWTSANGFSRHCLAILSATEENTTDWILQLADWTEQRRLGQRSGPAVLLLMDTLSFLQKITYDIRLNFDWMVKEGPPAKIWPVAAISFDLVESLGPRMLRAFNSQVIGFVRDPQKAARLAELTVEEAGRFTTRGRFAIQTGEQWLSFSLPGKSKPG